MQIVLSGNRVVAHGTDCFLSMGGTVICEETGKAYQNATLAEVEAVPADIDTVGYEYHAGVFIPCAPYGEGAGALMVACEDCGTPKRSKVTADADGGLHIPGKLTGAQTADRFLKVGDTLTTVRTDLGDKWLLCNGEGINASEYPELSPKLNSSFSFVENGYINIKGFDGTYYVGFNNSYIPMYSTSPAGPWTNVPLHANTGTFTIQEVRMYGNFRFFDDGYWYYYYGSRIHRTNDITSGVWEMTQSISGGDFTVVNGTIYHIGSYEYYSAGSFYRIGVAHGTIAGGMTTSKLGHVSYEYPSNFVFDGDFAYFVVANGKDDYYGYPYYGIRKFNFISETVAANYNPSYKSLRMVDAGNNLIVTSSDSTGGGSISWLLLSKETMSTVKALSLAAPNQTIETVISLDGVGMMQISGSGNKFLVYTYPEIGGGYTTQELAVPFASEVSAGGFSRWNDGTPDSLSGWFGSGTHGFYRAKALPAISLDGAYTYIKAKE